MLCYENAYILHMAVAFRVQGYKYLHDTSVDTLPRCPSGNFLESTAIKIACSPRASPTVNPRTV